MKKSKQQFPCMYSRAELERIAEKMKVATVYTDKQKLLYRDVDAILYYASNMN